ncbi:MAG TPA: hypothetical protein VKX28_18005 [Xanthobacteraceae bacterium]|nr:hypothetical protein [Xanthobacteraceae bacterium]
MQELKPIDVDDVAACAASALARACGRAVTLSDVETVSGEERRNFIARARAAYDDGSTRPVIVKMTRSPRYDPASEKALESFGLVREWTATALIAAHAPGRHHGATLLAGDVARGLLVFEDLGADRRLLADVLQQGTAVEAERGLALYASALGRLHADTAACAEAHEATFQLIFGAGRPRRPMGWRVENEAAAVVELIGGAPPASELALLSSRLADPGPWQCLSHGDPCPDNALIMDESIRLVDYEFARPGHALLDGIYWRIGFPTCWCAGRTPDDVARRIDEIYRAELARTMPVARDDRAYRVETAYVAAIWLFTRLCWRLDRVLKEDDQWGIWSKRGRLLWYLEFVIAVTAAADVLPGINASASEWLAALRHRWPDAVPLGLYPAFAATGR